MKNKNIENIKNIHNYKLKVYIMTTLSKLNYSLIEDICDSAYSLGVDGIIFNNYLLQGNAENNDNLIYVDTMKNAIDLLKSIIKVLMILI